MTNDLSTAIRNAEGVLSVARDNEKLYEGLHRQWREEVKISLRVLERLKEVAGDMPPAPKPAPKEEAHGSPLTPPAVGANGLDRVAIKRQLRDWRVGYPLSVSYHVPSQLARQALVAELTEHESYAQWRAAGGKSLTDSRQTVKMTDCRECADFLGVDHHAIYKHALHVQRDIAAFGTQGVDYKWKD